MAAAAAAAAASLVEAEHAAEGERRRRGESNDYPPGQAAASHGDAVCSLRPCAALRSAQPRQGQPRTPTATDASAKSDGAADGCTLPRPSRRGRGVPMPGCLTYKRLLAAAAGGTAGGCAGSCWPQAQPLDETLAANDSR